MPQRECERPRQGPNVPNFSLKKEGGSISFEFSFHISTALLRFPVYVCHVTEFNCNTVEGGKCSHQSQPRLPFSNFSQLTGLALRRVDEKLSSTSKGASEGLP
jgi:hypothetical protein